MGSCKAQFCVPGVVNSDIFASRPHSSLVVFSLSFCASLCVFSLSLSLCASLCVLSLSAASSLYSVRPASFDAKSQKIDIALLHKQVR